MARKKRRNPGTFIHQNRLPKENPSLKEIAKGQVDKDVESGEEYWPWMEKHGQQTEDGDIIESSYANPDMLRNDEVVPIENPTVSQKEYNLVMQGFKEVLTERECHIMNLLLDGFMQDDIAHNLGVKQQSVNRHINTARIKLKKYLQEKGL